MKEGFIIGKGNYAAIPFGNQLMIIYNGEQLKVCRTEQSARNFISQHKKEQKKLDVPLAKLSTSKPKSPNKPLNSKSTQKNPDGRTRKRNTN